MRFVWRLFAQTAEKDVSKHLAHFVLRLMDRCECGGHAGSLVNIVKASYRDIVGYAQAGLLDSQHGANGHQVIGRKDSRR